LLKLIHTSILDVDLSVLKGSRLLLIWLHLYEGLDALEIINTLDLADCLSARD
jgi:hypothetical protein